MSADDTRSASFEWRDCCPWITLVRTFGIAISLNILVLAAVGAVASTAGWRLASVVFFRSVDPEAENFLGNVTSDGQSRLAGDVAYLNQWPGQRDQPTCRFKCSWVDRIAGVLEVQPPADPLSTVPVRVAGPLLRLLERGEVPESANSSEQVQLQSWRNIGFYVTGWLWMLLVWSFFGGAITRIAVLRFGRDDRIDMKAAVGYARRSLLSQSSAVTLPLVGVIVIAIPLAILGLIMRLDIGVVLAGIFWLLVLSAGAGMAILLLGLFFGWPLMWGAIAAEGSDGFDAISRAYAYAFQRALNYLGYAAFVMFVGLVGWLLIWGFSEGVIRLGAWAAAWGMGEVQSARVFGAVSDPGSASGALWFGTALIALFNGVVRTIASGYGFSYFFSAAGGVYLLLRRDLDHTELDDIQSENDAAAAYGVPKLTEDESETRDSSAPEE